MASREQKSINTKTGIVVILAVAICISIIYTVFATWRVVQQNKLINGASGGNSTGISVKVGLTDVKMSFPGGVVEVMYPEQTAEGYVLSLQNQSGVKKAEVDQYGVVNLTVTRDYYQNMLTEMHTGLQNMLNEYVQSGDYFSFKELAYNANMTEFTIKVSKTAFETSSDSSVAQPIGMRALYYRAFCGDEVPQVKVVFLDYETGGEVLSLTYPEG